MNAKLYVQINDGAIVCIGEGDLTDPEARGRQLQLATLFQQMGIAIERVEVDVELD